MSIFTTHPLVKQTVMGRYSNAEVEALSLHDFEMKNVTMKI